MSVKKIFILIGSLILSANLIAQADKHWADSILHGLESSQKSTDYIKKNKFCDTLLNIFDKNNDKCSWIKTQTLKSCYQSYNGNYKDALYSLNLAYIRYNQALCKNASLLSEIYLDYGVLYFHMNENKKANFYVQKGIDSWQDQTGDKDILIQLYNIKGDLHPKLDSQLYYHQSAYKIALEIKNIKWQEISLNSIGRDYAIAGKNELAVQYFKKALKYAIKGNEYSRLSSLYNNLAGLSSDNSLVSVYLDSAIYFAKLKGDLGDIQTAYQNRAFFYSTTGQYKKAFDQLWESGEIKDSLYNRDKISAFADMEQKYESEKKQAQIVLLNEQNRTKLLQRNFFIAGMILFILLAGSIFIGLMKTAKEKKISESLLLNILPAEVADELKLKGSADAKLINEVTVLFTDFKGFTAMSEKLSPKELVRDIHECFSAFDHIMEKYGLEKIKTIGDAYMAAGGLPVPNSTHAEDAIKAAHEIIEFIAEGKARKIAIGAPYFEIRVGIHTGPVVAGIVGVKKFAYDIWGDTVNIASRMESSGEVGKVNISGTTYELVKDKFTCIHRGKIEAKGKGEIDMYFVNKS